MDAETWFTAAEAVEYGFADEVLKSETGRKNVEAAAKTRYFAQANFKNAPALDITNKKTEMSKNTLTSFLDGLKNLISQTEVELPKTEAAAEETAPTEVAAATEAEIAAAIQLLTDLGYSVEAPEEEVVEPAPIPTEEAKKDKEQTMTVAEVEALVAARVEAAMKQAQAAKAVTKTATAPKAAATKRDQLAAEAAKALDSLTKKMTK
jgi:hypothetical protein